jgi:DNA-binding beta-propeller fold protein YncE
VEVVGSYGLVLVADLSATNAIKAFSLCGDGNAAPVFETTMPAGTSPWDLDYDPDADRLYVAATNGTIQVYDDYMANPDAAPARIIDPNDQSGIEASNIHGIVHDSVNNRLIVSDVGSASVADDGRIYVIDNASTADGLTDLRLELAGDNTALGNPVDLAFDGTNLYVAEKSNNQIQRIDNIYALEGVMNRAPDKMMTFTAPESIAISAQ